MRRINLHVIHCSDSISGNVSEIRKWHKARGFNDVGYHFIIRRDGEIEMGRMLSDVGAHARGYNAHSIGTCLIGRDSFTPEQFLALKRIKKLLEDLFPTIQVVEHNKLNSGKTCPNFKLLNVLEEEGDR